MTVIEKKQRIKTALENFSEEQLDETLQYIAKVKSRDEKRVEYVEALLKKEQNLFERLAQ